MLLERCSPVGAESDEDDAIRNIDIKEDVAESNDITWEGWEDPDELDNRSESQHGQSNFTDRKIVPPETNNKVSVPNSVEKCKPEIDLSSLDIKASGKIFKSHNNESDLFADMEPAIPKGLTLIDILEEKVERKDEKENKMSLPKASIGSKFAVVDDIDADAGTDGWGDDNDWGEEF